MKSLLNLDNLPNTIRLYPPSYNILMNSKILKQQSSNKKKLILSKIHKESNEVLLDCCVKKDHCNMHSHQLEQKRYSAKENDVSNLPPLPSLQKIRVSVESQLEKQLTKRKYSLSSSSKLLSTTKLKPSCFMVSSRLQNMKIEDMVSQFISDFIQRGVFNRHFGKYLIQPKTMGYILLFALSSYNNSKNLNSFQRNFANFSNYEDIVGELEREQFHFKFGIKNNKRLAFCSQVIDLKLENEYKINMENQGELLKRKNQNLLKEIVEKRKEKQLLQKDIEIYQMQIDVLNQEIKHLNTQIMKEKDILRNLSGVIQENKILCERLEEKKKYYSTFLINFNNNKYNEVASNAKRLEEELFEYVQYLNFHPLGKRTYEKSKLVCNQLQQFSRYLIQDPISLQQKIVTMKNFIQKMREEYNTIINQLLIVIKEKTEFITNFTKIITKWHENYLNKKDVLADLSRLISYETINLDELKINHACVGNYRPNRQANTDKQTKIMNIAENIINIFLIAYTFF